MSAGHTSGPWEAIDKVLKGNHILIRADDYAVAKVYNEEVGMEAINEANARLIAAAPDLLEALEWALAELLGKTKYSDPQQAINCFELADAALAKARGDA